MNNVDPFAYLIDVLRLLDTHRDQLVERLPYRWIPSATTPVSPAELLYA